MEYKDIGFRDDKKSNRKVGYNANIILFSEKTGYQDNLEEEIKRGEKILYGPEAESISVKRLSSALEVSMVPLIGKTEEALKIF